MHVIYGKVEVEARSFHLSIPASGMTVRRRAERARVNFTGYLTMSRAGNSSHRCQASVLSGERA